MEFKLIEFWVIIDKVIVPFNILDADIKNYLAECLIQIIKEYIRYLIQSLPFEYISKAIIIGSISESLSKINLVPRENRISKTLSLLTIVANANKLDFNLLILNFSNYVEVYEDNSF